MKVRFWIFCLFLMTLQSTGLVSAEEGWTEYKARHFFIYYKKAPLDFIESIEESAERYYEEITRNLGFTRYQGWSFDERARVYVYDGQEDYVQLARMAGWSHGAANAKEKIIRTFPSAHGFFDSTLPHELGHIIFREFIGFKAKLPLWMEEGVAMYQEKAKRWGADKVVIEAMQNGTFFSLPELNEMVLTQGTKREIVELFYTESASVVYFIIKELGEYKFVSFCRKLKEGVSFERALEATYGRISNIEDLNRIWIRHLKEQP